MHYPAPGRPGDGPIQGAPLASTGRRLALVVLAHGYAGSGANYPPLVRAWAAAGYVVAAPTFPLSSRNAPGGPNASDYTAQPGDISFVITEMLDGPWAASIDPERVGVAGHSLGAISVLGLFNTCCMDRRVKAAIVMAGAQLAFGTGNHFYTSSAGAPVPMLFVHATKDLSIPYSFGRQAYASAPSPKRFLTLPGSDHVTPYQASPNLLPATRAVMAATAEFLDLTLGGDTSAAVRLSRDGNVNGVATLEAAP